MSKGLQFRREGIPGMGDEMVGLKGFGLSEPKIGNLSEHFAFARDAVGHDAIEGRDAVGRDEQKSIIEVKNFADLAAFNFFDTWKVELEHGLVRVRHGRKVWESAM